MVTASINGKPVTAIHGHNLSNGEIKALEMAINLALIKARTDFNQFFQLANQWENHDTSYNNPDLFFIPQLQEIQALLMEMKRHAQS